MNFIELMCFVMGLVLTIVIGRFLFAYLGWWAAVPAPILGFGLIFLLIVGLNRLAPRQHSNSDAGPDEK